MTILLSGGGTGGHITPIRSVARKIKQSHPDVRIVYVGERGGAFAHILEGNPDIDKTFSIFSGKFRRYHGETLWRALLDFRTVFLNIRDAFLVCIGVGQALYVLLRVKPDAVFLKGGYVGVPVGVMASLLRVPFMTHDSDAVPGLANRLVSRWASLHATALDPSLYPAYPAKKTVQTGVIVSEAFQRVDTSKRREYRDFISIPQGATVLFATGGSSGANKINQALASIAPKLLETHTQLYIIHQTGKGKANVYGGFTHDRLLIHEFLNDLHAYSGAADLIITRAGANTLAEFGCQAKACIVIPSPHLTGGHQLKNAQHLAGANAIYLVQQDQLEQNSSVLAEAIETLVLSQDKREELANNLHKTCVDDAADRIARHLLTLGKK